MHRIDFVLASNLRFLTIRLNCNKVLLIVKQSVSTIVVQKFMGLQICIKDTKGMVKNHKCEHLDYKDNKT